VRGRRKRFVDEYLIDLNATHAAIRAGYSAASAGQRGSMLLKDPEVSEEIKIAQKNMQRRTQLFADRVVEEYARVAFSQITDFVTVKTEKKIVGYDNENNHAITETKQNIIFKDDLDKFPESKISSIAEIRETPNGVAIKLHDKMKALQDLSRHLGLFHDNMHLSGADGGPIYIEDAKAKVISRVLGITSRLEGQDGVPELPDTDGGPSPSL